MDKKVKSSIIVFMINFKRIKVLGYVLMFLLICAGKSWCALDLMDPAILPCTKIIYKIETSKSEYEYSVYVDIISTNEGSAYKITSLINFGTGESEYSETIYAMNPFLPLFYRTDYRNLLNSDYYSKTVQWHWEEWKYDYEEYYKIKDKSNHKKYQKPWRSNPYLDLSLIYCGLLNGLPVDKSEKQSILNLSLGEYSADVYFKIVNIETINANGTSWECYKIEASPNLGPLLNFFKLFAGDLKSYVWLTTSKPRLVIKAYINLPWEKRTACLQSIVSKNI